MQSFLQFWQDLWTGYPDWLSFSALAVLGVLVLWIAAKLLVWCLKLVIISTVICVVIGCLVHFLG